jgi:hypothetical protein
MRPDPSSSLDPAGALAAAARPRPAAPRPIGAVLVAGGGGKLGAAVIEALLATGAWATVGVLVERVLQHALRGFQPVAHTAGAMASAQAHTAIVVFDGRPSRLGRDAAFLHPEPAALPALARGLHASGVRALMVCTPHRAGLMPQALQQGLASLDESAVAALGFEHLVFMRVAHDGSALAPALNAPERLARWMLGQLNWMVPRAEQAVRLETVARVAAAWATLWPQAEPGTRVLPTAVLWQAAQAGDARAVVKAWMGAEEAAS